MAQLRLWTKIHNKQWLVLGVSAVQCMRATISLVYIPAKIKMSFIWKDDFFWQNRHLLQVDRRPTFQHCSSVYTTIFVRRKDKTNYLSNQTWATTCGGIYSLKSTPSDRFFEKLFMGILFTIRVFTRNLLRRNRRRNIFHIFSFRCLTWGLNQGLTPKKYFSYFVLMSSLEHEPWLFV